MALQAWEYFKGVSSLNRDLLCQNLLYGLIDWLRWSTLQIGGYQNVAIGSASGLYGGDYSRLRLVKDPNFADGRVWEGFRSDWVWETGIYYTPQPTVASGVVVGGTLYPTASTTGNYAHYIDYRRGRVVFDSAIATTSVVQANFAHRTVNYVRATEPWFQELMFDSYKIDRTDYLISSSGQWGQLSSTRRTLPVVGIELVNRQGFKGYELGGGQYVYQDVIFYVMADNEDDKNQLVDILSMQNGKCIYMFNRGLLKESANYPYDLDYRGVPVDSPLQYTQLVAPTGDGGYRWRTAKFTNTKSDSMQAVNSWLYRGYVRTTCEIIMGDI